MLTSQARSTALRRPEPLPAASRHHRKPASLSGLRPGRKATVVRAVISSGDSKAGVETAEKVVESNNGAALLSYSRNGGVNVRAVIRIRKKMKERFTEKIEDQWDSFLNGIGRGISLQLISQDFDPVRKSKETFVRGWLPRLSDNPYVVEYGADFVVPKDCESLRETKTRRIINYRYIFFLYLKCITLLLNNIFNF